MAFLDRTDEILSVGEFSRRFKMLVKTQIPELWLRGEVSNLKTYSSGHTYFTLKDADASISAVLFKGYSAMLSFPLRDGMKMLAYGEVSVYEPRGSYQLIVKAAMPDGAGDLAQRFEQLKQKLSREGLFDPESKKSIPRMPQNIALITSASGAALRDFCRILKRRAVLLGSDEVTIMNEIAKMEEEKVICGYHTLIDWEKVSDEKVTALIEVRVTPMRGQGFDSIAERIYNYPEVRSVYLISGAYDLMVILEGKTLKQVSGFVSDKLSTLDSVLSTATHFILKKYKDHGTIFTKKSKDERMLVTP